MKREIATGYGRFCEYERSKGREPVSREEWEAMCDKAIEDLDILLAEFNRRFHVKH